MLPLLRVVAEVGGHDAELERLVGLAEVDVAVREDRPGGRGARLDADDLLHDPYAFLDVVVDVRLVALADEAFDLLRELRPHSPSLLNWSEIRPRWEVGVGTYATAFTADP